MRPRSVRNSADERMPAEPDVGYEHDVMQFS